MTGEELARFRPDLPVLLATGFMTPPPDDACPSIRGVVKKPFRSSTLGGAIRAALAGESWPPATPQG